MKATPCLFLYGKEEATPKTILRIMNIRGLTLYHLKSHLQKYRLGRQSCKELPDDSNDGVASSGNEESRSTGPRPRQSSTLAQELKDGCNAAMRVQMELQRRLHELLEVQKHIQIRIEAQDKYLQSILERACNILFQPDIGAIQLEPSKHDIEELPTREADNYATFQHESFKLPSLSEMVVGCVSQIAECSVDSCLTSIESPGWASVLKKRPCSLLGMD